MSIKMNKRRERERDEQAKKKEHVCNRREHKHTKLIAPDPLPVSQLGQLTSSVEINKVALSFAYKCCVCVCVEANQEGERINLNVKQNQFKFN